MAFLTDKAEIRKFIFDKRKVLKNDEVRQKSSLIAARVSSLPQFKKAKTVMVYTPFRNEVDTLPVIEECRLRKKAVVVPRTIILGKRLIPVLLEPDATMIDGAYGIPEPPLEALVVGVEEIDFVCVPGVAFSPDGFRVGYGAGYYDRFLGNPAFSGFTCGLAFDLQVIEQIPAGQFDRPVDVIVTESRLFERKSR